MNLKKLAATMLLAAIPAFALGAEVQADEKSATRELASRLAASGEHESAAIEYRRLALMTDIDRDVAGYYWAAAYQYVKVQQPALVEKMLDKSED
ncbi:MAG: hypothetical protein HQ559_12885, partial [Lentisphaerae bacterium]|nr:hypothetical protein [Lentisphaerota bacterium]